MAETQRKTIVANRGRRARGYTKKKNRGGPRHLSAKPIRFFGTPAQKAALKRKRKRGPGAKLHRGAARRRAVKKNSGEIVGYTLNSGKRKGRKPAQKGKATMAKTKKRSTRRRSSAASGHHAASRMNTKRRRTRKNTGHRRRSTRRRNTGTISGLGPLVTTSAFAIAGAVASKMIPQVLLGANNTGWVGYLANAGAGFALWLAAEKILKNRTAANGIAIGTAVQIIDRIINDMTPFGKYLSGAGFGDYQAQAFVTPQVLVDPYNSAQIRIPGAWQPPPPPPSPSKAAAAVGVGAYGGGNLYGGQSPLY